VPEPQREGLGRFISECALAAPEFRWTPTANLHLTVRFMGSVDDAVALGVADSLTNRDLRSFDIELGEVGTFKRGRLARVVWIGQRSGLEAARALAAQVEEECVAAGLAPEPRPFQAHLTLARARPRDGAVLPSLPTSPQVAQWRATELVLYSSHLGRAGSVYETLRGVPLN
jgi:2'-5' RNA ligase